MIELFGPWRLEVTKAVHTWENRYQIIGTNVGNGTFDPTVGTVNNVDGEAWALNAEHRENQNLSWANSDMIIDAAPDRVDIRARIGAEDPLPQRDFEDIEWDARWQGKSLFDITNRPYAVRIADLGQMPDGLFETAIGVYYMAVQITNTWGLRFTADHLIDITPQSRAALASRGIDVIDSFSQSELDALGQTLVGTGISLDGLAPGDLRTVFFKVDVRDAAPRKHEVTFQVTNRAGMVDPQEPKRFRSKQIFVSSSFIDEATGEIVSELQEGEIRVKLREVAIDRTTAKKKRRRIDGSDGRGGGPRRRRRRNRNGRGQDVRDLRRALDALLKGQNIDPCLIQDLLTCACRDRDGKDDRPFDPNDPWGGGRDPRYPSDGKFHYPPFLAFPTKFDYTVTPATPFPGQFGPIPYDDPWWKVLLIVIAVVLLIAGMIAEAADIAYQDEDLVIGALGNFQQDDIDAALCVIDTDRALAMSTVLDAQSDEDNLNPLNALNATVTIDSGNAMTHAEIMNLLTLPIGDPQRKVFKSGTTTGFTHGIISSLSPSGHPEASWSIDQVRIIRDPDFDEPTSNPGDSGSLWIHTESLRPVGLHHSGASDGSGDFGVASLIEDVQSLLNITV